MSGARRTRGKLAGCRILVTRARHQAGSLSSALRREGATVLEIPSIEIRPPRSFRRLDGALRRLNQQDWLILTSVNGVEALFARLRKLRISPARLRGLHVAAIGPATRRAIQERGLRVSVMPREYVAEAVVRALRHRVAGKRVLLVRARVARDVIPRQLRRAGAQVQVVEAYRTVAPAGSRTRLHALLRDANRRPHFVTFTSSSTARNLVALLGGKQRARRWLKGIRLASIGPVTTGTLRELGLRAHVQARSFTIPGLVDSLVRVGRDWSL
ncbi:MAG TPA: uroporphyrinogen-III synthase [Terriglobales bacterium]|nr:uroporphyrinogen-III synthase [Terriglobales bacterium]